MRYLTWVSHLSRIPALGMRVLPLLLVLAFASGTVFASNYFYDANGRLVAVTAPDGSAVEYNYDAVGNILSIQPIAANQLALFAFDPQQGAVGTTVTLQGNGFNTTPADDTVKFNSTAATVSSATANQLVVKVPSGATTGPISVTVGTNTVTSATNFIISQGPSISSFTPVFGSSGTAVTVNGNALNPISGSTQLIFDNSGVAISSITNTQLSFAAPVAANSSPIEVVTPGGVAQSSADFIVLPAGITTSEITATAQLVTSGSSQSLNISAANTDGIFAFNAIAGQWLSIQLSTLTTNPAGNTVNYTLYGPNGASVGTGQVLAGSNMSIHLPQIVSSGAYLVVFGSGSGTVQLTAKLAADSTVNSNGVALASTTSVVGQTLRFVFTADEGQNLGLAVTNLVTSPSDVIVRFVVNSPYLASYDQGPVLGLNCLTTSYPVCSGSLLNLPQSGTYTVTVVPDSPVTMSFKAWLTVDVTGSMQASKTFSLNLKTAGQKALLSIPVVVGQGGTLQINSLATTPANNQVQFTVVTPDGTSVAGMNASAPTSLTVPGVPPNAKLLVDPGALAEASAATMQLEFIPGAVATGNLPISATAHNFATTVLGEDISLTFSGTVGQNLGLGFTNVSVNPVSVLYLFVTVYNPDGSTFMTGTCYSSSKLCSLSLPQLPQTGTYRIIVVPDGQATISLSATLTQDVSGQILASTPQNVTLSTAGQDAYLSFATSSSQSMSIEITNLTTTPSAGDLQVSVYGFSLPTPPVTVTGNNEYVNLPSLPAGVYYLLIHMPNSNSATLTTTLLPSESTILTSDGTPLSFLDVAGGGAFSLTFTGNDGDTVGWGLAYAFNVGPGQAATSSGGLYVNYLITAPTGVRYCNYFSSTCSAIPNAPFWQLPATGTYTIRFTPQYAAPVSITTTLTEDVTGALPLGTSVPVNLGVAQNGLLTYTATLGQFFALQFTNISINPPVSWPSGFGGDGWPPYINTIAGGGTFSTDTTINWQATSSGTKTVQVAPDPYVGYTASANFDMTLYSLTPQTLPMAQTTSYSSQVTGANIYLTFQGQPGQTLGLGITNLNFSPNIGQSATVVVDNPDGSQLDYEDCPPYPLTNPGCEFPLPTLTQNGLYLITISQGAAYSTMNLQATLTQDVTAALSPNTAYNLNLPNPGQQGLLTFTATAGESINLDVTGLSMNPSGQYVTFEVQGPGIGQEYFIYPTGGTIQLTNLAGGSYTVNVEPSYALSASMTITAVPQ